MKLKSTFIAALLVAPYLANAQSVAGAGNYDVATALGSNSKQSAISDAGVGRSATSHAFEAKLLSDHVRDFAGDPRIAAIAQASVTAAKHASADEQRKYGVEIKAAAEDANAAKMRDLRKEFAKHSTVTSEGSSVEEGRTILMFASKSMSDGDMLGLMNDALAHPNMRIIFRGGDVNGGVAAISQWLSQIGKSLPRMPPVSIDPPSFRKYQIKAVPEAVILDNGVEVGRVGGVYSVQWISEQLAHRTGDLGSYGHMSTPIELDMSVQVKDRIQNFDWKDYMGKAIANFWRQQPVVDIPHATVNRVYRIDTSVIVPRDVVTPDGKILARRGDRINPLAKMAFRPTILVIDGHDQNQRRWARSIEATQSAESFIVMTVSTPVDWNDSWAEWKSWETDVGDRMYFFSKKYAARLPIAGTPSRIVGDGLYLKVDQVALVSPGVDK